MTGQTVNRSSHLSPPLINSCQLGYGGEGGFIILGGFAAFIFGGLAAFILGGLAAFIIGGFAAFFLGSFLSRRRESGSSASSTARPRRPGLESVNSCSALAPAMKRTHSVRMNDSGSFMVLTLTDLLLVHFGKCRRLRIVSVIREICDGQPHRPKRSVWAVGFCKRLSFQRTHRSTTRSPCSVLQLKLKPKQGELSVSAVACSFIRQRFYNQ